MSVDFDRITELLESLEEKMTAIEEHVSYSYGMTPGGILYRIHVGNETCELWRSADVGWEQIVP